MIERLVVPSVKARALLKEKEKEKDKKGEEEGETS